LGQTQLAFALGLLLRKNMIEMGLGSLKSALSRPAEALGSAPVSFHLRHLFTPLLKALLRTGQFRPMQAGFFTTNCA